jgi:hydrogenase maturation protease
MLSSSKEIAIIGLGNTLRRDDGIGIHVLALLEEKLKEFAKISFLNFGIASFGLINTISDFKEVILIDAIDAGLSPATLRIFKIQDALLGLKDKKISSHELSLADLLHLYSTLGLSTEVHIAGIQVKDTSYGLEMSKELERAKVTVADEISVFIRTLVIQ